MRTRNRISFSLSLLLGLLLFASLTAAGSLAASRSQAAARPLDELPRLSVNDLTYLGSFSVPNQDANGRPLGYSGHALSYNPANHSLYFGGHDWYQELCEVGIPEPLGAGQTATILQNCTDVSEGRLGLIDDGSIKLGGTLLHQGQLIVSAYSYYDADGNQSVSHFVSSPDLSQSGDVAGPFAVGDWAGVVSGYMAPVPAEWQAALGGPVLTGNCCLSIISRTSYGPAVTVFDPQDLGSQDPAPNIPLLAYPADHPLAEWDATSPLFNGSTQIRGIALPPGSRSLLFFGRQGIGEFCYGTGEDCGDPVQSSQGTHAYPYVHQVWAYDLNDLASVSNGDLAPWEVQPYAVWRLDEMDDSGSATLSGAAYDPAGGRVYLTENYGEDPQVHVYQVSVPAAPGDQAALYLPLLRRPPAP